ncbi:hypothetical protein ABFS83_05G003900 [Erythranthe nasuta]
MKKRRSNIYDVISIVGSQPCLSASYFHILPVNPRKLHFSHMCMYIYMYLYKYTYISQVLSSSSYITMDLVQYSSEHICYVRCNFCNTILAVEIPRKQMLETVTVKCGHCSNLSFLSTKPPPLHDLQTTLRLHGLSRHEHKKGQSATSSSSSSSTDEPSLSLNTTTPPPPFVVKRTYKRHRLPSAYNMFMKEEIQRIKAANPEVPHREAFSAAAKNWSRYIPNTPQGPVSRSSN